MSDLFKRIPDMGTFKAWLQDRLRHIAACYSQPVDALEYWSKVRTPGLDLKDMLPQDEAGKLSQNFFPWN